MQELLLRTEALITVGYSHASWNLFLVSYVRCEEKLTSIDAAAVFNDILAVIDRTFTQIVSSICEDGALQYFAFIERRCNVAHLFEHFQKLGVSIYVFYLKMMTIWHAGTFRWKC